MPQANKPAMTSGPGALSQRTDGGPASKQVQRYISGMPNYGDATQLMDMQASAPMSQAPKTPVATPSQVAAAAQQGGRPMSAQGAMQQVTPLNAPTQRPSEPVTTGSPMGPGAGPEALGIMPGQAAQPSQSAKSLIQALASHPDASPELQQLASALGK
jgi:hypothetical protein